MRTQSSVPWDPNSVFWLAGSKITHSVCVALVKILMQSNGTWHTKTWSKRLFVTLVTTNAWTIIVNPVLTLEFWRNFLIRNSTNMKMRWNLITLSGTLRIKKHWQRLQPTLHKKPYFASSGMSWKAQKDQVKNIFPSTFWLKPNPCFLSPKCSKQRLFSN